MLSVKPIEEFSGKYSVLSDGRIFSNIREDRFGRKFGGMFLSTKLDRYGYPVVSMIKEKRKKVTRTVHRLVALTFIDNPDNHPTVNHKDGNKENNSIDNLEWVSWKQNTQHSWDIGLCKAYDRKRPYNSEAIRDRNRKARKHYFCQKDVDKIKQLRGEGLSQQKIADIVGIPQGTISHILRGTLLPQEIMCGI